MKKPEFIFACKKCGYLLYVEKEISTFKKLLRKNCPNCGEDPDELWILIGEGNYDIEYSEK